jgi:hypothetical protein
MTTSSDSEGMTKATWAERFGISQDDIKAIKGKITDGTSVLAWCLAHGKIAESDYLQWASETSGLPLLNDEFFAIHPDQVFWDAIKSRSNWSPEVLPLAEWDGILLIACVEAPDQFQYREPHAVVLASPRLLALHWRRLNPKSSVTRPSESTSKATSYSESKSEDKASSVESELDA